MLNSFFIAFLFVSTYFYLKNEQKETKVFVKKCQEDIEKMKQFSKRLDEEKVNLFEDLEKEFI